MQQRVSACREVTFLFTILQLFFSRSNTHYCRLKLKSRSFRTEHSKYFPTINYPLIQPNVS